MEITKKKKQWENAVPLFKYSEAWDLRENIFKIKNLPKVN